MKGMTDLEIATEAKRISLLSYEDLLAESKAYVASNGVQQEAKILKVYIDELKSRPDETILKEIRRKISRKRSAWVFPVALCASGIAGIIYVLKKWRMKCGDKSNILYLRHWLCFYS